MNINERMIKYLEYRGITPTSYEKMLIVSFNDLFIVDLSCIVTCGLPCIESDN